MLAGLLSRRPCSEQPGHQEAHLDSTLALLALAGSAGRLRLFLRGTSGSSAGLTAFSTAPCDAKSVKDSTSMHENDHMVQCMLSLTSMCSLTGCCRIRQGTSLVCWSNHRILAASHMDQIPFAGRNKHS